MANKQVMSFKELEEKVGYGKTVAILYENGQLPESFLDAEKTGFLWGEIYNEAIPESKLEKIALDKMSELLKDYDQWFEVYKDAPPKSKLKETAFKKLVKLAIADANQKDIVYLDNEVMGESKREEIFFKALSQLTKSFEWWLELRKTSFGSNAPTPSTRLLEIIQKKMEELAETFDHWLILYKEVAFGLKSKETAFFNMQKTAQTFDQWFIIYKEAFPTSEQRKEYSEFFAWHFTRKNISLGDDPIEKALDKMVKSAVTFYNWFTIYQEVPPIKSEVKELALKKMLEMKTTFDEWKYVYHKIEENQNETKLKAIALDKMVELAVNFYHWFEIYKETLPESEQEKNALSKMEELKFTFPGYKATFDEWQKFFDKSRQINSADHFIAPSLTIEEEIAVFYLIKLATDIKPLVEIRHDLSKKSKLTEELLLKIAQLTSLFASFKQCRTFYYDIKGQRDEIEEIILKRMADLAASFDEFVFIFEEIPENDDEWKESLLEKIAQIAKTSDQWTYILNEALWESKVKETAVKKMAELLKDTTITVEPPRELRKRGRKRKLRK